MRNNYGWEKLHSAVHILSGAGDQKDRVITAIRGELIHINLDNGDLPEEMKERFQAFWDEVSSVSSDNDEGSIAATINSFDYAQLSKSIEAIISMYDEVCGRRGVI